MTPIESRVHDSSAGWNKDHAAQETPYSFPQRFLTILLNNDPYLANLAMLPEAEMNALLYGDWASEGAFFREWTNDSALRIGYGHVVDPFIPPRTGA